VVAIVRRPVEKTDTYGANMVITRDRTRQEEALSTYIDRQLIDLAKKLKRFVIRGRTELTVDGAKAHEIQCTWQGVQGVIEQFYTVVPRGESTQAAGAPVITFTASALKHEAPAVLEAFRDVVKGISFVDLPSAGDQTPPPGV
jgi:hypothetical protein